MQKNNNKLQKDTNHVGAYCIRPHFEGNTGITLIALIVTIIVLIILAAVSLNVLLGQNGIIGRAQQASRDTQIASAKERIEMDILDAQIDTYGTTSLQDLKDKGVIDEIIDETGIAEEDGYLFKVEEKEDGSFEVEYIGKEGEITIVGTYSINPETMTSKVEITVKGTYLSQGIKEIEKPDGSKESGGASTKILETTYEVTANGEYTFKIVGNDNKTLDYKVTISNIDTEFPSGSHTLNPVEGTWGTSVEITVTGNDSQGIQSIEKPDNMTVTGNTATYTVTANGDYIFKIKDTNGNITDYTVTVENIDREGPTANHTLSPNPTEQGASVTITLSATDSKSGVKEIIKPDTNVATGNSTTYTVTANGEYTFTLKDNLDNSTEYKATVDNIQTIVADGTWDSTNGANTPDLPSSMIPVAWDGNLNEFTPTKNADWYNYIAQTGATTTGGTSKWANAKTQNGSYLVWIPRYEYKMINGEHGVGLSYTSGVTAQAGTIDVKFIPLSQTTPTSGYKIHPAFTNSGNNGLGELTGIWVGKFESSNDGSGNVKIVPNVAPYTGLDVSTLFSKSQNFKINNSLAGYDSHMMKNTEWGCVAYLAHSKYGRNGTEVTINNYYNNGILTGYAGYTVSDINTNIARSQTDNTSTSGAFPYNNTYRGVLASTTGNIYGIYDMSGGGCEYTMGVNNSWPGYSNFSTIPVAKYCDNYITTITNGDAVYETSGSDTGRAAWFRDYSTFPSSAYPWFIRGGDYSYGSWAGLFAYNCWGGNASPTISSREVLTP